MTMFHEDDPVVVQIKIWEERDARYYKRRLMGAFQPLSAKEAQAVVWWRKREIESFDPRDQGRLLGWLVEWVAPSPVRPLERI